MDTAEVFFIVPGRPDQRHLLVEPWLPPENLFERQLWKVLRPRDVGRESDDDQTERSELASRADKYTATVI